MNYLDELLKRNQAGQPSVRMPSANYGDGLGIKPPASFGDVSGASTPQINPMLAMSLLQQGQPQVQEMPTMQIPAGSNLSYEELLKMYGIQGLLG